MKNKVEIVGLSSPGKLNMNSILKALNDEEIKEKLKEIDIKNTEKEIPKMLVKEIKKGK